MCTAIYRRRRKSIISIFACNNGGRNIQDTYFHICNIEIEFIKIQSSKIEFIKILYPVLIFQHRYRFLIFLLVDMKRFSLAFLF